MISVLLADDHPFLRAGVEAMLRGSQYEIVAMVSNGTQALEAIGQFDPAVCLFDVRMPGLDGVELLEKMRAAKDTRPVVMLTAELDDAALVGIVKAGVNGIVLKDSAFEELIACLDGVMRGERVIQAELLQRALDLSLAGAPSSLSVLAPREKQIAELVARGMRNRDIAARLGMTEGTVKVYLHAIYQKLGIENRTELALIAHGQNRSRGVSTGF